MGKQKQLNQLTGNMHHDLLGLRVLLDEIKYQGVSIDSLLEGTSLNNGMFNDPDIRITTGQKLRLLKNAQSLAKVSEFALRAGARQRISDYGIFGYAMATTATFRESLDIGFRFLPLSGTLLTIDRNVNGNDGVFVSLEPERLGDLLPVVAEFWRASMHGLLSHILEEPFPHTLMLFPYKPPPHWRAYEQLFRCPVHFGQDIMEWHFDASVLNRRNPNANQITARTCERLCQRLMDERTRETDLVGEIQSRCLISPQNLPTAKEMAKQLDMSNRTLHRKLVDLNTSYKTVTDGVRKSLAIEFLTNTSLAIDEIASRIGYHDTANFRKAFKRWTGLSPSSYRNN